MSNMSSYTKAPVVSLPRRFEPHQFRASWRKATKLAFTQLNDPMAAHRSEGHVVETVAWIERCTALYAALALPSRLLIDVDTMHYRATPRSNFVLALALCVRPHEAGSQLRWAATASTAKLVICTANDARETRS